MGAKLIDGHEIAASMRKELQVDVDSYKAKGIIPDVAIVLVEGSQAHSGTATLKANMCKKMGINCEIFKLSGKSSEEQVVSLIEKLNDSPKVHGINIHPLPIHFNQQKIYSSIAPQKDLEGLNPINMGNFVIGKKNLVPFTPQGVLKLIESTGVDISGKKAVIIGRSDHVGKPLGFLLLEKNATVSYCHTFTKRISHHTKDADILVVAIGHAERIVGDIIKPGAIVIDVGVNLIGGHVVGDVEFDSAKDVAGYITPVPGGVGPMTIAMMIENLLSAMKTQFCI